MLNLDLPRLSDTDFRTLRRAVLEEKRRRDSAPAVVKHDDRVVNPGADTVPDETR